MKRASEVICAERMKSIATGREQPTYDDYSVYEVAVRYGVTPDAVYRGIRSGSPLYPEAQRDGLGPRAPLVVTAASLEACDARRIAFYRTTPSWLKLEGRDREKPPPRRAARALLGTGDDA